MSDLLARARILRDRHRHEEAVALIHQFLAQEPDHPQAHLELAVTRTDMEGMAALALEDARRASGLMPGAPFPLALQARNLSKLDRLDEALRLAEAAISLGPERVFSWNSKTIILSNLGQLARAEQSARHARALAPDDADAANLLAFVLRARGKVEESLAESRAMLARDPDNPVAFTIYASAALDQGEVKEAEKCFKEALRLDPMSKRAKLGLKQAYHQRSAPYRLLSGWVSSTERNPWIRRLQAGLIMLPALALVLSGMLTPIQAICIALGLFYLLVIFCVVVAPGMARFLIQQDRVARLSLSRWEKVEGVVIAGMVFGGFGLTGFGALAWQPHLLTAGLVLLAAAIPMARAFNNPSRWRALGYLACALLILLFGIASAVVMSSTPPDGSTPLVMIPWLFMCLLITILVAWRCKVKLLR